MRGAVAIGREGTDKRPLSRPNPLPDWCVRELTRFHGHALAWLPARVHPLLGLATDPRWLEIAERLGSDAPWSEQERSFVRARVLPMAETQLQRRGARRRHDPTLYHFFVGVRVAMTAAGHGDPKPSQLALLAAAAGIEPLDEGLTRARRRWEDRLRRWPAEMDRTDWRPLAAQIVPAAIAGGLPS